MLRYAAVCCSCNVLQCVAVCCSVLRCVAVCLYSYIVHGHLVTRPWHNHWEGRLQHCVAVCCCVCMSQYCSVSLFTVHTNFETQYSRNTPCLFWNEFCKKTYAFVFMRPHILYRLSRSCTLYLTSRSRSACVTVVHKQSTLMRGAFHFEGEKKRQPTWRLTNHWRGSCTADTRWRRRIL